MQTTIDPVKSDEPTKAKGWRNKWFAMEDYMAQPGGDFQKKGSTSWGYFTYDTKGEAEMAACEAMVRNALSPQGQRAEYLGAFPIE